MFPIIKTIYDVLSFIDDKQEFIISKKSDYLVIDYVFQNQDTFDMSSNGISYIRECRGIIFDKNGNIIRRPLHKFFNINEKEMFSQQNISFITPYIILEKLDGSMVAPFIVNDKLIFGSMAGETFITDQINEFLKNNSDYIKFSKTLCENGFTPIFEWCTRKNRIVIDYPIDRLVLTAVRNIIDGTYISYDNLKIYSKIFNIELVKSFDNLKQYNIDYIINNTKQLEDSEGIVLRFNNGEMIKIKADSYVKIHNIKSMFTNEKNVLDFIFNNKIDDLVNILPKQDFDKISKFDKIIKDEIESFCKNLFEKVVASQLTYKTKKEYALSIDYKNDTKYEQSVIFHFIENPDLGMNDIYEMTLSFLKKYNSSSTNIEKCIRPIIKKSWNSIN